MKLVTFFLSISVLAGVGGCGSSKEDDVRQWMAEERNQAKPKLAPIPEPKKFKPESYVNVSAVEPFSKEKLTQALKRESSQSASNGALVAPELARRKEPLEVFPIDTMNLVGTIVKAGAPVALVKVDKLLYQVKVGNYLGLNYGKVLRISETEVTLREIVQDVAGEWTERVATLQLQEKSK
jgi:type IV pilus assembly protein PilP